MKNNPEPKTPLEKMEEGIEQINKSFNEAIAAPAEPELRTQLFRIIEPAIFNKDDSHYLDVALGELAALVSHRERISRINELERFLADGETYGWGETFAIDIKAIRNRIAALNAEERK